jgi:hypothetical protein
MWCTQTCAPYNCPPFSLIVTYALIVQLFIEQAIVIVLGKDTTWFDVSDSSDEHAIRPSPVLYMAMVLILLVSYNFFLGMKLKLAAMLVTDKSLSNGTST